MTWENRSEQYLLRLQGHSKVTGSVPNKLSRHCYALKTQAVIQENQILEIPDLSIITTFK